MRHVKRTDRFATDELPKHTPGRLLRMQVPSDAAAQPRVVGSEVVYAGLVKLGYGYGLSTHTRNVYGVRKDRTQPVITAFAYHAECVNNDALRAVTAMERAKRARR